MPAIQPFSIYSSLLPLLLQVSASLSNQQHKQQSMCLFQVRQKKSHKRSHRHSHSHTSTATTTATATASTRTSLSSSHSTTNPLSLSPYTPTTTMCPPNPQSPYQVPFQPSPLDPNFMHLFGGLNMGMDWYGEHARQIRNASVHRDINFVNELKDRVNPSLSAATIEKERDREVHKLVEMMQARDRKEEIAKATADGVRQGEEKARVGAGMGWGNGMGGGGGGVIGGGGMGGGGMGFVGPAGGFPFNPSCPVHGHIYGRHGYGPCYHCQALIGNGRGVAGYFGP